MRTLVFAIAAAAVSLLGGCNIPTVPLVKDPSARVVDAKITEQTVEGTAFTIALELSNPNDFTLPLLWESYRVTVGDESFTFAGKPEASLPPLDTQTLTLTGAVVNGGQDLSGASYTVSGQVLYEKPGEIRKILIESGLPEPRMTFSGKGELEQ